MSSAHLVSEETLTRRLKRFQKGNNPEGAAEKEKIEENEGSISASQEIIIERNTQNDVPRVQEDSSHKNTKKSHRAAQSTLLNRAIKDAISNRSQHATSDSLPSASDSLSKANNLVHKPNATNSELGFRTKMDISTQ